MQDFAQREQGGRGRRERERGGGGGGGGGGDGDEEDEEEIWCESLQCCLQNIVNAGPVNHETFSTSAFSCSTISLLYRLDMATPVDWA